MDTSLPRYIDSTMISCFRSCPQKFYKEFVLGLRPTGLSVDLHAGGCFATAIETVGRAVFEENLDLPRAIGRGFAAFMDAWGDFVPMKDTPKTRDNVWRAIEEYFLRFSPRVDHIQPFLINGKPTYEYTFAIPLEPACHPLEISDWNETPVLFPLHPSGEPFLYSGRLDRLGTWNGKVVGQDEKTTTSIGSTWASQWNLRSQFIGYCWALQQCNLDVDTIAVRGVGILKTKITLVEAMPTYNRFMIGRWHDQLRRDMWRLRRAHDEGHFDFNLAESCSAYGGCAFRDLCASPNEENWYSTYTVRRWNPLQKNPIAEAA
jgi:hypothetical protein